LFSFVPFCSEVRRKRYEGRGIFTFVKTKAKEFESIGRNFPLVTIVTIGNGMMVRELCLCSEVRKNSSQLEEIFLLLPSEMVSELCSSQLEEIFLLLPSEMVRELCSSQFINEELH
jgi:hypothetical protein